MKTTVYFHSADNDGLFCREIAKKFLPRDTEFIGWDFKNPPLTIPEGTVYVLDLPIDRLFGYDFSKEPLNKFLNAVDFSKFIWIDHHFSSIKCHPKDIPGYRIDGVAASRLCWQYFISDLRKVEQLPKLQDYIDRKIEEPYAVRLVGEFDIWDKRDSNAETFQYGLKTKDLDASLWNDLLTKDKEQACVNPLVRGLLEDGRVAQKYAQNVNTETVNSCSYIQEFEGLKFLAMNTTMRSSLVFDAKDVPETGHDALMVYSWTGKLWKFSLYQAKHRKDIDLSEIARKYPLGGGHRGACGFQMDRFPF